MTTKKSETKSSGKFERPDGRKVNELRPIWAKVGVVPNADGSAIYASGDTIAIAAVYGPKQMHPQHSQNPEKGTLRCTYLMNSFSVNERIKPGPNRRSNYRLRRRELRKKWLHLLCLYKSRKSNISSRKPAKTRTKNNILGNYF